MPTDWFFPAKHRGQANSPDPRAVEACRGCPIRAGCLLGAIQRDEPCGVWGGAGEARRRVRRRAWRAGVLDEVAAAHWRRLDGVEAPGDAALLEVNGAEATHGRPGTYAKGCRCDACSMAVSMRSVQVKLGRQAVAA